jgi:hypothetical protein
MKSVVGPVIVAVVLAAAGAAFSMAGQSERRLAELHQQLATLQYGDVSNDDDEGEARLGMVRRLPRVGDAMASDVRDEHALAQYWRSEYAAVEPKRDSSGALTDTDPQLLLVSANAEFRASQRATDRADLLRRLDRVVKTYSDVLKTGSCGAAMAPASVCDAVQSDAAYNYEYVVRLTRDVPSGPTLHGYPGAPPKGTDMSQFKIVIPKRGEERKDNPEAGKGGAKVRKG